MVDLVLLGLMTFFCGIMIWLGINTWYEFRHQLPFFKVREGYSEKNLKITRILLRVYLIGAQLAGWIFLIIIIYDWVLVEIRLLDPEYIPTTSHQESQHFLFKVVMYALAISFWLTCSAISVSPAILWTPVKMFKGRKARQND